MLPPAPHRPGTNPQAASRRRWRPAGGGGCGCASRRPRPSGRPPAPGGAGPLRRPTAPTPARCDRSVPAGGRRGRWRGRGRARSGRQPVPALEAAGLQDGPAGAGRHALAEAVVLGSLAVVGLERSLQDASSGSIVPSPRRFHRGALVRARAVDASTDVLRVEPPPRRAQHGRRGAPAGAERSGDLQVLDDLDRLFPRVAVRVAHHRPHEDRAVGQRVGAELCRARRAGGICSNAVIHRRAARPSLDRPKAPAGARRGRRVSRGEESFGAPR